MKKIPEHILKAADRCPHDYRCLTDGTCAGKDMCNARSDVGGEFLYLETLLKPSCHYSLALGQSMTCSCPVRTWLFVNRGV